MSAQDVLLVLLFAFLALVLVAAVKDAATYTIPNWISLALIAAFVPAAAFAWQAEVPLGVIGVCVTVGLFALLVGMAMFAFGWIGGGDAKLAAATALWLGFNTLVEYLLISTVAGGLLTLAILYLRVWPLPAFALRWDWLSRLHDRQSGVPYGIALAGAALVVYPHSPLWGGILGS